MIIPFIRELDATEMSCQEIAQYMRDNGWSSFTPDWNEYHETGKFILIRKAA